MVNINFTLKQLQVFTCLAKTLNMTAAGNQLCMTTPAVHKQIRNLEVVCGQALFVTVGKKLLLSKYGQQLLSAATELEQQAIAFNNQLRTGVKVQSAPLSIVLHNTIAPVFYKAIRHFCQQHPFVDLKLASPNWRDCHSLLPDNEYDIIILAEPKLSQIKKYEAITLFSAKIELICSSDHPLAALKRVTDDVLANEQFLTGFSVSKAQNKQNKFFKQLKPKKKPLLFDNFAMVYQATKAGLGLAFLPDVVVAEDIKKGSLVRLPYQVEYPEIAIMLLYPKKNKPSESAKNFIDTVTLNHARG